MFDASSRTVREVRPGMHVDLPRLGRVRIADVDHRRSRSASYLTLANGETVRLASSRRVTVLSDH